MAAIDINQIRTHTAQRAPLRRGQRWDRKGRDPALLARPRDVCQKGVIEGWVTVIETKRAVAVGIVQVGPHFEGTEPGIDTEDFAIEAESLDVSGKSERGAAFPCADFDDAGGSDGFDQLTESGRIRAPSGGIVRPRGWIKAFVGINAMQQRADTANEVFATPDQSTCRAKSAQTETAAVGNGLQEGLQEGHGGGKS